MLYITSVKSLLNVEKKHIDIEGGGRVNNFAGTIFLKKWLNKY